MKRVFILLLIIIGTSGTNAILAQAQEQKPASDNSATIHYSQIYQRALRYNDISTAKNALYNLVSLYPQNDSLLYSLSVIYFQTQKYASAALVARDVLTLNPNHDGALEVSAVSFEQIGANEQSINAYEQLYLKTDDYQSLYKMAFLQYEMGRLNEALTNADILLNRKETADLTVTFTGANNEPQEYPIKAALYNLKGLIAKSKEEKEKAREYFNQALEIAPEFVLAKENLESL